MSRNFGERWLFAQNEAVARVANPFFAGYRISETKTEFGTDLHERLERRP